MAVQRLSSEGGVTALLGATAGFFLSQSTLMKASTAAEGWQVGGFLVLYVLLFAAVPLMFTAKQVQGFHRVTQVGLALAIIIIVYCQIVPTLITITASSDGNGTWTFNDPFALPLMVTPMIWLLIYVFDEIMELSISEIVGANT